MQFCAWGYRKVKYDSFNVTCKLDNSEFDNISYKYNFALSNNPDGYPVTVAKQAIGHLPCDG